MNPFDEEPIIIHAKDAKLGPGDAVWVHTGEAEGALPNGTRIVKQGAKPGDAHQDGSPGLVVGSLGPFEGDYLYFVVWDDQQPPVPVGIKGERVRPQ